MNPRALACLVAALTVTTGLATAVPAWTPDGTDGGCGLAGGCARWSDRRGVDGLQDFGHDVAFSPDGDRVYAVGQTHHGDGNDDPVFVAHDAATGQVIWSTALRTEAKFDEAGRVLVTPDGDRLLATIYDPGSSSIVAIDAATGDPLWTVERSFIHVDAALDPDASTVYFAGTDADSDADTASIQVVAIDVATGDVASTLVHRVPDADPHDGGISPSFAYPRVAVDGDGVYATARMAEKGGATIGPVRSPVSPPSVPGHVNGLGLVGNATDYNVAVVGFEKATGDLAWSYVYRNASNDTPTDVEADGDRVHVTGYTFQNLSGFDYLTITLDAATGVEQWNDTYDGPARQQDASMTIGDPIAVDGDRVYVTGGSTGAGMDVATVAYDAATGDRDWVSRLDLGPWDRAHSLHVGPDGDVHATGWTLGPRSYDYLSLTHDADDGTVDHVRRWDGDAGVDQAFAGTISPDGTQLVLTGAAQTAPGVCLQDLHEQVPGECSTDMATVALPVDPSPAAHAGAGL